MKITKYIHSCLLIEKDSDRLLFDPGLFTFAEGSVKPSQFENISAIIVTHKHPDHIDADSLKQILENNETAIVLANSDIVKMLSAKGIGAEVFEKDERTIGGFKIEAMDAAHEAILADELPQNTAYIIDDKILHPGDSYDKALYERKGTPVYVCRRWLRGRPNWGLSISPSKCRRSLSCRFTTDIQRISFWNRGIRISKNTSMQRI